DGALFGMPLLPDPRESSLFSPGHPHPGNLRSVHPDPWPHSRSEVPIRRRDRRTYRRIRGRPADIALRDEPITHYSTRPSAGFRVLCWVSASLPCGSELVFSECAGQYSVEPEPLSFGGLGRDARHFLEPSASWAVGRVPSLLRHF